jgi:hypothetical protein
VTRDPAADPAPQPQRTIAIEIVATFEGRFVYRVRCSFHGTVEATIDYARAEAAKVEHRIEHDLEAEAP